MARTVGSIGISLFAKNTKFKKGMRGAEKSLRSFTVASKVMAADALMNIGSRGIGAARSIAGMTQAALKGIDTQAKFAKRLGMTNHALGQLEHAAELSGNSSETMRLGLQRMTRRINEAAHGTGEAQKALRELGIDAQWLNRLKPEQQFAVLADNFEQLGSQSDRVRLAMRLFDSEGVALVNTMKGGSAALIETAHSANKLGVALSAADASKVESANESLAKVGAIMKGLGNRIAVELAPFLEFGATKLTEWATEGEGMGAKVSSAFSTIIDWTGKVGDAFKTMSGVWNFVQGTIQNGFGAIFEGASKTLGWLEKVGKKFGKDLDLGSEGAAGLASAFKTEGAANLATGREQMAAGAGGRVGKSVGALAASIQAGPQSEKTNQLLTDLLNEVRGQREVVLGA